MTDETRALVHEARQLEARRVEISALAAEGRWMDLLPEPWLTLLEQDPDSEELIEITLHSGLTEKDADLYTERELRDTVRFYGQITDAARLHKRHHESQDDDA